MLQAGAPAWLLVVTTYIVNLRHYLMAASLAPYFAHLSRGRLALLAHGISDESYALTHGALRAPAGPPGVLRRHGGRDLRRLVHGRHPRGSPGRPDPRSAPVRARLRVPGRLHRDPGADDPGALAMGGGGRRRPRWPSPSRERSAAPGTSRWPASAPPSLGVWLAPARHRRAGAADPGSRRSRPGEARPASHVHRDGRGHLPDPRAPAPRAGAAPPAGVARAVLRRASDRAAHRARAAARAPRAGERPPGPPAG